MAQKQGPQPAQAANRRTAWFTRAWPWLGCILVLTGAAYVPTLFNELVPNWDDGVYLTQNAVIASLDLHRIFTSVYASNYHPFVALTHAVEYHFFGLNPFIYHFDNVVLHLLNTWLVFTFVDRLTRKRDIALFVSLFFGIHPMHVESVAWAAERKDVLFAFFYLLALVQYTGFVTDERHRMRRLVLTFVFALGALFSKSAAVTLPLLLLLIDWFCGRRLRDRRLILEKVPFFALSLVFGLVALETQKGAMSAGAANQVYAFHERMLLASYATGVYLYKMFVPIALSAVYPYPGRTNGALPMSSYASAAVVLVIAVSAYRSLKHTKYVVFGLLFFLVTIALVLQILPVGGALVAERYSYLPYIGTFLVAGYGFSKVLNGTGRSSRRFRPVMLLGCGVCAAVFLVQTFQRTQVWRRGDVLFEDAAAKNPVPVAFNNVGYYHYLQKDYASALAYYTRALEMEPNAPEALKMRGIVRFELGRYDESVEDLTRSLALDPGNRQCYIVRANALNKLNRFEEAVADYDVYLKDDQPREGRSHFYRGLALFRLGRHEEAIRDFDTSLALEPGNVQVLTKRGAAQYLSGRLPEALADLNAVESLDPGVAEAYSWRGLVHYNLKQLREAIRDSTTAIRLDPADGAAYCNRALSHKLLGEFELAVNDALEAQARGYRLNIDSFKRK